jgi:hypothetical protein
MMYSKITKPLRVEAPPRSAPGGASCRSVGAQGGVLTQRGWRWWNWRPTSPHSFSAVPPTATPGTVSFPPKQGFCLFVKTATWYPQQLMVVVAGGWCRGCWGGKVPVRGQADIGAPLQALPRAGRKCRPLRGRARGPLLQRHLRQRNQGCSRGGPHYPARHTRHTTPQADGSCVCVCRV